MTSLARRNASSPAVPPSKHGCSNLSFLRNCLRVSASTQNQALDALLFLYREVLQKEIGYVNGQEVRSILGSLDGPDWLIAMLLYGAGLRLMECLQLRVKDIDFVGNHIANDSTSAI